MYKTQAPQYSISLTEEILPWGKAKHYYTAYTSHQGKHLQFERDHRQQGKVVPYWVPLDDALNIGSFHSDGTAKPSLRGRTKSSSTHSNPNLEQRRGGQEEAR